MSKNMAVADRAIRVILAVVVAGLYATDRISGLVAGVLGLLAVIFIVTSFMGSCPLYTVLGFSTKKSG